MRGVLKNVTIRCTKDMNRKDGYKKLKHYIAI